MVRVNKQYPGYPSNIRKAYEIGAGMVLLPQINTREEAIAAVRAAKFGPEYESGSYPADQSRGWGSDTRAGLFHTIEPSEYPIGEYFRLENQKRMVAIQFETTQAFENAKEIMSVKGIDDIIPGFGDLSASLGHPGLGAKAPGVAELIAKYEAVRKKFPEKFVKKRNIDWKEVLNNPEGAKSKIKQGIKEGAYLFNIANERAILKEVVKQCKRIMDEAYKEVKNEKI